MSFIKELKRRNVFRVGVAYLITAWLLLQLTDVLTDLLGLPEAIGKYVVAIGLSVFAYSTLIGWSYYGEECIEFLFGIKARFPYRLIFCVLIAVGACVKVSIVWNFSDVVNGLMAIPNLVGLLGLSYVVYQETMKYFNENSDKSRKS